LVEVERRQKRELSSNGDAMEEWKRCEGKVRWERWDWGDETIGRVEFV
jgi:hypothetical protein